MFFADLPTLPPDPILGMATVFAADPSPDKVDLGIGIYKDEQGSAPVLRAVKEAERHLVETQASKAYFSPAGNPAFNQATASFVFGDCAALRDGRIRTVQTPGGTAALRVAADFVRHCRGKVTVWLPDPSWANHQTLCGDAGLTVATYPYYDRARGAVQFAAMRDALRNVGAQDVVLLHGCCHNPTGADLDAAQWTEIAAILALRGALATARSRLSRVRRRAGAGCFRGAPLCRAIARVAGCQLLLEELRALSRPGRGGEHRHRRRHQSRRRAHASVARGARQLFHATRPRCRDRRAHTFDAALRSGWLSELETMRARIASMRYALVQALHHQGAGGYDFIATHRGMFTSLGVTPDQVKQLRDQHHIHMSASGRMNLAGLTEANVHHVARALASLRGGADQNAA